MCGIAGFTQFASEPPDRRGIIQRMMNDVSHRGPDGEGCRLEEHVALGHRRLSIIDLETGAQPMSSPDGRFHLIFNGKIYNYLELRADLLARGYPLRTHSDTEVLLGSLVLDGVHGLQKLNGMFAFAFWDSVGKRLLLARDRIGEKPLYFAETGRDLVFASEIRPLFHHPALARSIDPLSVAKYLTYGWVPAPHTIYRGVQKLMPGHYAWFSTNGLSIHSYWDLPLQDRPINPFRADESARRFRMLLEDSIRLRLRSDVPVGLLLSGGLDSSVVAALAARQSTQRLTAFSVGFDEPTYDESPYARLVAEQCGVEHVVEIMTARHAAELLPRAMQVAGEPSADASLLPTLHLFGFTSQHVRVALGGDGGDELMAGYAAFQAHRIVNALSLLPAGWRDVLTNLARRFPVSSSYASMDFLMQQFLRGAGIAPEIRFMLWLGFCGNAEREALLSPAVRECLLQTDVCQDIFTHVQASRLNDAFQRISYLAFKMYLQDGVLVKVDRASMAHGLEIRSPFLDHRLVEFSCNLQPALKLRGLRTKLLLKRSIKGFLPNDIIHRRKAGFMMPVARWLQTDLREMLETYCADKTLRDDGIFSSQHVRQLIDEHVNCRRDHRKILWAVLCFQCWRQQN